MKGTHRKNSSDHEPEVRVRCAAAREIAVSKARYLIARSTRIVARVLGLAAARTMGTVANTLALILVARWLGPEEFGDFAAALAIIMTTSGVFAFGLPVFALRAAVLGRVEATGYALFLNLFTSVVGAILGFVLASMMVNLAIGSLALLAVSMALEKNAEVRIGLGTEFDRAALVNWTIVGRSLVVVLVLIVGHSVGYPVAMVYIVGRLIAMGIAAIVLSTQVQGWHLVTRPPQDGSLDILGSLAAQKGVSSLRLLDVTLVALGGGPLAAGLYAGVQRIVTPITGLGDTLRTVVMGVIARGGKRRARDSATLLMLAAVALTVLLGILSIWSPHLVRLILGGEFSAAVASFRYALLGVAPAGVATLLLTILQDKGFATWATWSTVISVLMLLIGAAVGGHLDGANGAMLAFLITNWVWAIAMFVKIRLIPLRDGF